MRRLVSVLLLPIGACAHYSQQDGEQLETEVFALQTRLDAVESKLDGISETQAQHSETLSKLVAEVGDLNLAARRNDADFGVQLEDVMQTMARLEGSTALLDERVSTLESATTAAREELDLRLENLEGSDAPAPAGAGGGSDRQDQLLADPKAALDRAAQLIDRGQPETARRLVRELMLRNEKQRSFRRHAARAQFLIAESYFAEGSYQQAAAEYNEVRKSFPKASEVPTAFLKLGLCFERLGLPSDAKLFYETLVKQHPRSSAAAEARKRLKQL